MSYADVAPYFRARIENLGFSEWRDTFNFENIPATELESIYHLSVHSGQGVRQNHFDYELNCLVEVRFFKKGFRDSVEAKDAATIAVDSIIKECCKYSQSRVQTSIKDITFSSFRLDPIADTNDNFVIGEVFFNVKLYIDVNQ